MARIELKVEIDFESWMDIENEPKNKQDWREFFMRHLIEYPKSILGEEIDGVQKIISLNNVFIDVIQIKP